MDAQDFRSLQEAYNQVHQLDEISDRLATAARNTRQRRLDRSVARADTYADAGYQKQQRKTDRLNQTLASREQRTGSKIKAVEQLDLYDIILSHLLDEGYAETIGSAEAIMVNMSEDWRSEIVEAYVDYTKGKLSTGKSPQQRLAARHERVKATAARERGEASSTDSLMTPATKRSQKLGSVRREMDAHTGLGGKINKALSPGLGGRAGASPRVAYGEPNTDRHQLARFSRGQASTRG